MLNKRLINKIGPVVLFSLYAVLFPAPLQAQTCRFIVAGDSRGNTPAQPVNTEILGEIAAATVNEGADFILLPGDLVWGSGTTTVSLVDQLLVWRTTMQPVYSAGIGVYPIRGNHDAVRDTAERAAWNSVFSGAYALPDNGPAGENNITYSFSHENVFIVALDDYVDPANPLHVNQAWITEQFAQNDLPHVFVYGHVPAFKALHADCLDDYPSERNSFWSSIAAEGGRVYFAGHDHFYAHARIDDHDNHPANDVHQYIVGTAGAPLYTTGPVYNGSNDPFNPLSVHTAFEYGYVVVDISGNNATITWKHRTAPGVYEAGGDVFAYTVPATSTTSTSTAPPADTDHDGIPDSLDNCPAGYNPQQLDADTDQTGDVCDPSPGCGGCGQVACEQYADLDHDGIPDVIDNCPNVCNPQQLDADTDQTGDGCDTSPGCGGCGQVACEAVCAP